MVSITLEYNPDNALAKSIIESVETAGVFQIKEEKSPYDEAFVSAIQKSRKSKGVAIATEDLWK